MLFLSVIVPVYCVEAYIHQCIQSILSQSFENFELILVDDGSPDKCPEICDIYAQNDERVRVIHQQNGGLSNARNSGLKMAKGKYILFLDSDDFLTSEYAFEQIYNKAQTKADDVIILQSQKFDNTTAKLEPFTCLFSKDDLIDCNYDMQIGRMVSVQLYDACAWNKAFSKSLTEQNNLFFTEGIIGEDIDWAARLCLAASSISVIEFPVHAYRKGRPGAITGSIKLKNLIDTRDSIFRCVEYVRNKELSEKFLEAYYGYIAYRYVIWLAEYSIVHAKEKYELFVKMKELKWLLKYRLNPKVKMAYILYVFFGLFVSSKILGLYLKCKTV